ncbi:MAG: hemolysin D [Acidobacteria bacterium]|nr:MAG: hemolysin D [Acidobacteriota bacterium]
METETIDREAVAQREPSLGEEIANAVTHSVGAVASIVALVILAIVASRKSPIALVAFCVFGASMIALYTASAIYHALPKSKAKEVFFRLDHAAIYLLIAGTYTPFTLGVLRGGWGWTLFTLQWSLAAVGITFKSIYGNRWRGLSMAVYIMMGWMMIVAIWPMVQRVPASGLALILAGGLFYTGGTIFNAIQRLRFNHMLWHIFVLIGSGFCFFAVLNYAMPA